MTPPLSPKTATLSVVGPVPLPRGCVQCRLLSLAQTRALTCSYSSLRTMDSTRAWLSVDAACAPKCVKVEGLFYSPSNQRTQLSFPLTPPPTVILWAQPYSTPHSQLRFVLRSLSLRPGPVTAHILPRSRWYQAVIADILPKSRW